MNSITIFIILITIIIVAIIIWKFHNESNVVMGTIVIAIIIIVSIFYLTSTEGGKRLVKDLTSNVSGGIPRHVKVYDINGHRNYGDHNSGHYNIGNHNSGNFNIGDYNTGDCNEGKYNSGDSNKGNFNTGDLNTTNYSNGCFNTVEPNIYLFNKLSDWTLYDWRTSEAHKILQRIRQYPRDWNIKDLITKDEMIQIRQKRWNQLDKREKEVIMSIPNFDKNIFKEITGIDVEGQ